MPEKPPGKRTSRGMNVRGRSVSATEAQNHFGAVLSRARAEGVIFITRYERPEAVVLSMEQYEALVRSRGVDLDALEHEFDRLYEAMQRPEQQTAHRGLFSMTGRELGEAVVRTARAPR